MKETRGTVNVREDGFLTLFYNFFRSLKLTITLLILLASLSIIGTLIIQNASRAEYLQRYGMGLYEVLNFFNLFDMYHSWWFSAILLLLVINLITCSVQRLPGIWSQISRAPTGLEDSLLRTLPYMERVSVNNVNKDVEENINALLKKWPKIKEWPKWLEILRAIFYSVYFIITFPFQLFVNLFFYLPLKVIYKFLLKSPLEKVRPNIIRFETEFSATLFLEKGRFSRLGVYITHSSLLIILIGGMVGSLYGFKGRVEILKGETVDRIFLRARNEEIPKSLDFSVRCDEFKVTYYDLPGKEKHVKEYTSFLTILKNGKEALKKAVQVNHPLHYEGLAFYQANYGTIHDFTLGVQWRNKKLKAAFKVSEGATVPVPNSNALIRALQYAPQIHNFGEGVQVVLFEPNQEPRTFWLLKAFPKFDEQRKDDFILSFEGDSPREYTGLSVTKDPGVWVVWIGCGLMIFGLIVSFFFSHQRVWVRISKSPGGEIVLAGSANKNRLGFEKTFGELVEEVHKKSSELGGRS